MCLFDAVRVISLSPSLSLSLSVVSVLRGCDGGHGSLGLLGRVQNCTHSHTDTHTCNTPSGLKREDTTAGVAFCMLTLPECSSTALHPHTHTHTQDCRELSNGSEMLFFFFDRNNKRNKTEEDCWINALIR